MNPDALFSVAFPAWMIQAGVLLCWGAVFFIHLLFAIGVWICSRKFCKDFDCDSTHIVPGWTWSIATMLGGPLVAGVFWLCHFLPLRTRA